MAPRARPIIWGRDDSLAESEFLIHVFDVLLKGGPVFHQLSLRLCLCADGRVIDPQTLVESVLDSRTVVVLALRPSANQLREAVASATKAQSRRA